MDDHCVHHWPMALRMYSVQITEATVYRAQNRCSQRRLSVQDWIVFSARGVDYYQNVMHEHASRRLSNPVADDASMVCGMANEYSSREILVHRSLDGESSSVTLGLWSDGCVAPAPLP